MKNEPEFFQQSLSAEAPPEDWSVYLKALWYERKGQWNKAHSLIDHLAGKEAATVHAYLHRREGDIGNAGYWYRQAGIRQPDLSLDEEWESLLQYFISHP
jgi:hypothetical protein